MRSNFYHCRCWRAKCRMYGRRFRRKLAPSMYLNKGGAYKKFALCPSCRNELVVDQYRTTGLEATAAKCECAGYPWTHRKASWYCETGVAGKEHWTYNERNHPAYLEWLDHKRDWDRAKAESIDDVSIPF